MSTNSKLSLKLYKDEIKQIKFLLHFALTFRLLPETLADLFGLTIEQVNNMLFYSGVSSLGLDYLINHEFPDQAKAKAEAIQFYRKLISAVKDKDKIYLNELLNYLYDKSALSLIQYRNENNAVNYTDEDLRAIIRYMLKYSLGYQATISTFQLDPRTFQARCLPLLEENPELKRRYEYLSDYFLRIGGRK